MYENVTILLQGLLCKDIDLIALVKHYSKLARVVISIYDYQLDLLKQTLKDTPVHLVIINNQNEFLNELEKRKIPEHTPTDECHKCYFQIRSILNALQFIQTENVLYCRLDHFYLNIEKVIQEGLKEKKFVTSSLVVRGIANKRWKFHFSDCLAFGTTEKMKLVFSLAETYYRLENITYRPNECRIWRNYFIYLMINESIQYNDNISDNDYISYVLKHMIILPLQDLGPFYINSNKTIRTEASYPFESKTTAEYLENGTSCLGF